MVRSIQWNRIVAGLGIAATLPTLGALFTGFIPLAELLTHFRVQYAVILVPLALILAFGKKRAAIFVGVCALFNVVLIGSLYLERTPEPAISRPRRQLKLLSVNVHTSNRDHAAVLELIEREDPDVVIAVEVDLKWTRALSALHAKYPTFVEHPQADNFGVAMYARTASTSVAYKYFKTGGEPAVVATCTLGQRKLRIFGLHPVPPVSNENLAWRDEHLEMVAQEIRKSSDLAVVAGDLNVTPWSPAFRRFLENSGLEDGRRGFGVLASWPNEIFYLRIPIDHVLVDRRITVRSLKRSESVGSDHFAMIAELEF